MPNKISFARPLSRNVSVSEFRKTFSIDPIYQRWPFKINTIVDIYSCSVKVHVYFVNIYCHETYAQNIIFRSCNLYLIKSKNDLMIYISQDNKIAVVFPVQKTCCFKMGKTKPSFKIYLLMQDCIDHENMISTVMTQFIRTQSGGWETIMARAVFCNTFTADVGKTITGVLHWRQGSVSTIM